MTILYESYRLESIDSGYEIEMDRRSFVDVFLKLFPNAIRKKVRQGQFVKNVYEGIKLKPLEPVLTSTATHSFEQLISILPCDFVVKEYSEERVLCNLDTFFKSNGNTVQKNVTFHKDLIFSVIVGQQAVDLKQLGISNRFLLNQNSIDLVCQTVRKIELCHGIEMKKTVKCTRFHTLDAWRNENSNETTKRIRSVLCLRVAKFTSKTNVCRICQHMTMEVKTPGKENLQINDPSGKNITKEQVKKLIPGAPEEMVDFLVSQAKNICTTPKGRRWSQPIMSKCLQLYAKSPHFYKQLRDSKLVVLPSPAVIVLYKNRVKHAVGFQDDIFRWMHCEARRLEIPEESWDGGILVDEMAIQEDIQINKHGDIIELTGFENVGQEAMTCGILRKGKKEITLGNHVLQFIFLGNSGFRFPFAHFISTNIQAYELDTLFWEAVYLLKMYGFNVSYVCMDGAQSNRTFMHINIGKNATSLIAQNPCEPENPVIFLMDSSHVFKKIRNNVIKSGIQKGCTRHLQLPNGDIINWEMWADAYTWDKSNALQLHRKLTNEHIYPSPQSKMRNHLAEQALNTEMLHLMLQYQLSLGNKGSILNGAIEFLKKTSRLIELFHDTRPIRLVTDERLQELKCISDWFENWTDCIRSGPGSSAEKAHKLISQQCLEDIRSCIIGFCELCYKVLTGKTTYIIPALINSDAVENHFCQERSTYNGANTNPNALQYRNNLNSIILGQNIVSHKCNTGKSLKSPALAYSQSNKKTVKRKKSDSADSNPPTSIKVLRM
ncbi:uncharacterized protein LOC123522863 isoform X2 [Mercenaria mercenaria]|nr:uncharacterized protein LOC123522863 isoform X2 [Mercenaria mercenaria]